MADFAVSLTPLHFIYLIGVITVLTTMILRKDTPLVCIVFLFLIGLVACGTLTGAIQSVFASILYAAKEFMEIIATIALITALSKCLSDLGSDRIMMRSMSTVMKNSYISWWVLGITMLVFSLFLWPSPSVALVGAILLPLAVKKGLKPLAAAMALNLFGHGVALSGDFVIQGAPAITASAAGIDTHLFISEGMPLFLVMSVTTVVSAFIINRKEMGQTESVSVTAEQKENTENRFPRAAMLLAILAPAAFIADVVLMAVFNLKGGDATSLVSGTAVVVLVIGSVAGFGKESLDRFTNYISDGFLFAIRIFAPVIIIGAFFFLGGSGITTILGEKYQSGILNDWAVWLAGVTPLNKYVVTLIQMVIGGLTGLDGSGFSGLPLVGSLANTFGTAVDCSVPLLGALGQIAAIFIGGGTIIPWGLMPVAAIANVNPLELARKNFVPVMIGFFFTFLTACLLI
ncbi:citrate transporter [Oscillibacter sp.]|uniref:citrate transporter n=1 Tax=Oscillibacter sp. TaxID=1945593 RepID=UPI00339528BE